MLLVARRWKNATSRDFAVKRLPGTFGYWRGSGPLLSPRWVPAEPTPANAKLRRSLFGATVGFEWPPPGFPCLGVQACRWFIRIFSKTVFLNPDKIGNLEAYLASVSRWLKIFPEKYQKHVFVAFLLG